MDHDALAQFPILKLRNKTGGALQVLYLNDSVQIAPGSVRSISSKGLLQVPDPKKFEFVSPTLFELERAGVIDLGRKSTTGSTGSTAATGSTAGSTGATGSTEGATGSTAATDTTGSTGPVTQSRNN